MTSFKSLEGTSIAGKYRLDRLIGRGGFSAVFLGLHIAMNRKVAIKVLDPMGGGSDDTTWTQRFSREARVISQLRHPNTITVFDYGSEGDMLYLVMEFIEGETLKEALARGALDVQRAASMAAQILASLEEAHHYGVLHRDLKPANIMLAKDFKGDEVVKVLDFGIAKLISDAQEVDEDHDLTQANSFVGTPRYSAPEQLFGRDLSPATDVYAVGAILWEMVVGRPMVEAKRWRECAAAQIDPTPWRVPRSAGVPAELMAIIERAVSKDKDTRYASTAEMRAALEHWAMDPSIATVSMQIAASVLMADSEEFAAPRGLNGGSRRPMLADDDSSSDDTSRTVIGRQTQPQRNPSGAADQAPSGIIAQTITPSQQPVQAPQPAQDDFWSAGGVIDPNIGAGGGEVELLAQPGFSADQLPSTSEPTQTSSRRAHPSSMRSAHERAPLEPSSAEFLELDLPSAPPLSVTPTAELISAHRPLYEQPAPPTRGRADEGMNKLVLGGIAGVLVCVVVFAGIFAVLRASSSDGGASEAEVASDAQEEAEDTSVHVTGTPEPRPISRFSRKGILYAMNKVGWKTSAVTDKVEMGTFTQETFPLYRKNAYIEAVLMTSADGEMLEAFANQTEGPARVVMFDDKAVRLTPKNVQGRADLGELEAALLKYRTFVLSNESDP